MATVEDEQPSSSTSTFSKEEVNKLMSQGKRHFVCNEIVEAVKCFEVACLMLNKKYGTLSNECGDAHFQYGKSLLELARLESGVLGSALKEAVEEESPDYDEDCMETEDQTAGQTKTNEETAEKENTGKAEECSKEKMEEDETEGKVNEKTTDDNKESVKEEEKAGPSEEKPTSEKTGESAEGKVVEDTREESKMEDKSSDNNKDNTKEGEKENDKEDVSEDTSKSNKESTNEEHKEVDEAADGNEAVEGQDTKDQNGENNKTEEQNVDKDNKDEDVIDDDETTDDGPISTIQLAWETLELARIIFKRHNNTDMQLKLAQTHLLLGEIHMEQEQFSDAISELTKCLNIQKNLLKPDDRLLAETYYNLGLAYTLSMMYEESASHYANASEVLELRIKNIKARIEEAEQQDKGKGKASDDDPLVKDRKEIVELEDLLPEVKEKCLDAKNENERLKSNIRERLGLTSVGLESSSSTGNTSCSDKPANDISHLVRKKRKPTDEESTTNVEAPTKKPRQESEGKTTQPENGDSTMAQATGVEPQS